MHICIYIWMFLEIGGVLFVGVLTIRAVLFRVYVCRNTVGHRFYTGGHTEARSLTNRTQINTSVVEVGAGR